METIIKIRGGRRRGRRGRRVSRSSTTAPPFGRASRSRRVRLQLSSRVWSSFDSEAYHHSRESLSLLFLLSLSLPTRALVSNSRVQLKHALSSSMDFAKREGKERESESEREPKEQRKERGEEEEKEKCLSQSLSLSKQRERVFCVVALCRRRVCSFIPVWHEWQRFFRHSFRGGGGFFFYNNRTKESIAKEKHSRRRRR